MMTNLIVSIGHKLLENPLVYDTYQNCVGSVKYRKSLVASKTFKEFNNFLDIGCGTASTVEILQETAKYVGIDISVKYLEKARKRKNNITLLQGNVAESNWTNFVEFKEPVMCIALGIYHHLSDSDLDSMLINCKSVLPKGSQIFSMDPVITPQTTKLACWFAENDRGKFVRTPKELENIFNSHGFSLEFQIKTNQMRIPLDSVEVTAILL
jgi:predicted TPR repeat methyltransferase